jgi:hypothetical protein
VGGWVGVCVCGGGLTSDVAAADLEAAVAAAATNVLQQSGYCCNKAMVAA